MYCIPLYDGIASIILMHYFIHYRGLLRKGDITFAKKLALLTRSGRPELDTYESSRGPYSFIRVKDLGRSGRIRFMQPSSQVIEGSSDEGESVKSAARYSELEQQLLQSFAQRGGGFGIPLLPGKEVLSMDLLEDFMGRNLILETVPHPNNLSIGGSTGKSSNGQDNAKMSVPATSMEDDQASQTLTIPSTWASDVGQGRDMDKVVVSSIIVALRKMKLDISVFLLFVRVTGALAILFSRTKKGSLVSAH